MPKIEGQPKQPLDFARVEALRKHLLLTVSDMAVLLGVSRMSYYGWLQGKPIRSRNEEKIRTALRRLLHVVREHNWPTPDVISAGSKVRFLKLIKLLYPERAQEEGHE